MQKVHLSESADLPIASINLNGFNFIEAGRRIGVFEDIELPARQLIYSPGEPADSIYFIRTGKVRLWSLLPDGKNIILALLGSGDIIDVAEWETEEHSSYAETVEDSCLYKIMKSNFEELIKQNPDFGLKLIQSMGLRLKQMQSRLEDLVVRPVPGRVARLLISLAENHGRVTPHGIRVEYRLTHQEIASMVGSTRATVTQILKHMRSHHLINVEAKRVTIQDLTALENFADARSI